MSLIVADGHRPTPALPAWHPRRNQLTGCWGPWVSDAPLEPAGQSSGRSSGQPGLPPGSPTRPVVPVPSSTMVPVPPVDSCRRCCWPSARRFLRPLEGVLHDRHTHLHCVPWPDHPPGCRGCRFVHLLVVSSKYSRLVCSPSAFGRRTRHQLQGDLLARFRTGDFEHAVAGAFVDDDVVDL